VRQFISITTIAILLTATACAPETIEVSCPRLDPSEPPPERAQYSFLPTDKGGTGIFFFKVPTDSFWACAGIEEHDMITEFNSLPLPKFPRQSEPLNLISQDDPLELSVLDSSGDRRIIVVR
jgi:hypothetical protein